MSPEPCDEFIEAQGGDPAAVHRNAHRPDLPPGNCSCPSCCQAQFTAHSPEPSPPKPTPSIIGDGTREVTPPTGTGSVRSFADHPTELLSKAIARAQILALDDLAEYCDYPTRFEGRDRKVVAHALRLAARTVIERQAS